MPPYPLPPDPGVLAEWERLPKNAPSRNALPPMTDGIRWSRWLLLILAMVVIFGLLQGKPG